MPASDCNLSFEGALARVVLRDGLERVRLCPPDLVLADLARRLALSQGSAVLARVEIPRGAHDLAVALAMEAQLARLRDRNEARSTAVTGSIIVVGTDTAVQARLGKVSVQGISLDKGLRVGRIRGDGRIVLPGCDPLRFQPGRGALLYLNTRVGWPRLPGERDGLVLIDRTSFAALDLLDGALRWAREHGARHILVLHDQGDMEARQPADLAWTLDCATLAALDAPAWAVRDRLPASGLTLIRLVAGQAPRIGIAHVGASVIETLSSSIHGHIVAARRIANRLPYPLFAAARLLGTANALGGQVRTHDQTAALMPRAQPLGDLARAVEGGHNRLEGSWAGYRETRYAALQADVTRLFSALDVANPKFEALVFLLDDLRRRQIPPAVVVRASDDAAALALEEDLFEFDADLAEGVHVVSLRQRLPWAANGIVEVLTGLPPPWRRDALWSGEARERIVVAYGWEAAVLQRVAEEESARVRDRIPPALAVTASSVTRPTSIPTVFRREQRATPGDATFRTFDLDLTEVIGDLEPEPYVAVRTDSRGRSTWPVLVRPVTLSPDGAVWLVPEEVDVEVLLGDRFRHLRAAHLKHGDNVIVPRGSGRESLFARALAVVKGQGAYVDVEFILGRWRRACRALLKKAGTPQRARRMLTDESATTSTQLEAWADGTTLAPNDCEDMARVARLAGDEWLLQNWKRVATLVRQVRGSHISLGHTISGAMRETVAGRGPNLDRLADLLGVDAAAILDEFDARIVESVSDPICVPAAVAGAVVPAGSLLVNICEIEPGGP
ncbi:MAG TPA: hypothetical protein VF121_05185 [Thermoanaerobaculia bacterium]|nr:hypothetical protein [Thermoanaerobaculia bacterium]